jgi:hypothetical protein
VFLFLEGASFLSIAFAPSFSSKIPIKRKESDKKPGTVQAEMLKI